MKVQVKICGINGDDALAAAAGAGADWVGFVFFPRSPRFVTPAEAAAVSTGLPGGPKRVGLFVEPDDETIKGVLAAMHLDAIQVYTDGTRAAALRRRFRLPVWQAWGIGAAGDLPARADGIDRIVLEAKPPPLADRPGGNAAAFDWTVLRGWIAPAPWLLAGGLDPTNVAKAIRLSGAPAVDVSSGVEISPGVKDAGLIHAFIRAAHGAD